ncbi:MAG: DAK2 domain-containing protein [Bacillota bacterium]
MAEKILDGKTLRQMLRAGTAFIYEKKGKIDELNVFPVPDGDTGVNMYLTFLSALKETEKVSGDALGLIMDRAAQGALMGARGNSGVIVSQFFRGFAAYTKDRAELDAEDLSEALMQAVNKAYQAVMKPVEGTILTVAREAAEKALQIARNSPDIEDFAHKVLLHAKEVLLKTPDMLPVLKQAGVVDAGGYGLICFMEGALAGYKGQELTINADFHNIVARELNAREQISEGFEEESSYQYCTEFILRGRNLNLEFVKNDLSPHGDCLLVVGDAETLKIHIHTDNPGIIVDYAVRKGEISEVQINNMWEQSKQRLEKINPPGFKPGTDQKDLGLVAVASGDGLIKIFHSLGVDEMVCGGQSMNPSAEDLLLAVQKIDAKEALILPNNKNIILTASQVKELTDIPIMVVPTRTIPQGIAAMMAYNPIKSMLDNIEAMTLAAVKINSVEITYAVRDAVVGDYSIRTGDILSLLDGELCLVGESVPEVLLATLKPILTQEHSIVSIYSGSDISESEAQQLCEKLIGLYPKITFELYNGGQPLYYYLCSIE